MQEKEIDWREVQLANLIVVSETLAECVQYFVSVWFVKQVEMSSGQNFFDKLFGGRKQGERVLIVRSVFVPIKARNRTRQTHRWQVVIEFVILRWGNGGTSRIKAYEYEREAECHEVKW